MGGALEINESTRLLRAPPLTAASSPNSAMANHRFHRLELGMLEFVITQSCRLGFVTWEEAERHEHCSWVLKGSSAPVRGREETFVETQLHVFNGFLVTSSFYAPFVTGPVSPRS